MNIYIACAFAEKVRAREIAAAVVAAGHCVVSTWHESADDVDPVGTFARNEVFEMNAADIADAACVVADTTVGNPRATWCEIGMAVGLCKDVVWITGFREQCRNIFTGAPMVYEAKDVAGAVAILSVVGKVREVFNG